MIREVKMYSVTCDGCKETFIEPETEFCAFTDECSAREAACQLSPNSAKTAEDIKKLICDEIDFQNTGNILI